MNFPPITLYKGGGMKVLARQPVEGPKGDRVSALVDTVASLPEDAHICVRIM